jgi:hypothetical protein
MNNNFAQTMATNQQDYVKETPVDANGNPERLYTGPTYTMSNGATTGNAFAGQLNVDADGLGVTVVPAAADVDTFTLTITAEADPTPGVNTLTDTVVYTITAPEDVTLGTVVNAPTAQPTTTN